jgi:rubrerythrin
MSEEHSTLLPARILEAALRKEEASCRFYEGMLRRTNVSFIKELLEELRDEESKHISMIKHKISRLRAGKGI